MLVRNTEKSRERLAALWKLPRGKLYRGGVESAGSPSMRVEA